MSTLGLRKAVAIWFFAVYVFVGVPLWYKLTTIYRAPLPIEHIRSMHENPHTDLHLVIPVYVKSDTYNFPDVHDAIQVQVNELLKSKKGPLTWSLQVLPFESWVSEESDYVVTLALDNFIGYTIPYDSKETIVFFNDESVVANDIPFFVAQTLIEHTFGLEWQHFSESKDVIKETNNNMAISYTPNVHLSISLLTGDGRPVAWDIVPTLEQYFTPLRRFISPLVNFTVDTGIVYYNDLKLGSLSGSDTASWQDLSHTVDLSELSSMNYYSERTVLNLAIVFPGHSAGNLSFINSTSKHDWQSFLVPQWGVLVINKSPLPDSTRLTKDYLTPIIYKFSRELFQLLGLATQAADLSTPYVTIDSFKRLMIIRNLDESTETLWSLVKLVEQFPQMAVPEEVLVNVRKALDLRLQVAELINDPFKGGDAVWNQALLLSNELFRVCEDAFFHKEMVQQNFFPQEHKIAVYLPLLGPLTVIMLSGLVNAFKRKQKEESSAEKDQDVKE